MNGIKIFKMNFLKKNWLVILVGCLSAFLGVLTLMTVVNLKKTTPVAPTVPQKEPQAMVPACTLSFKLSLALTPTTTGVLSPTPGEELSPTPTEIVSQALTAVGGESPTATPTSKPNTIPVCTGLSAKPLSGVAPLKVSFTGNGLDQDGKITAFEFSFGDAEKKTVEKDVEDLASHSLDYTYVSSGSYWATLRVKDNNNAWSEIPESCQVKIEVKEVEVGLGGEKTTSTLTGTVTPTLTVSPTVSPTATVSATPIPVPELPEAGLSLPTILSILSGSLLVLLGILL